MTRPAIVLTSAFQVSESKTFKKYVDYINRKEAIRNKHFEEYNMVKKIDSYNEYMENPEKSTGLFTLTYDSINEEERDRVTNIFRTAQENGSLMWQDVFSFDNEWLIEQGLYDAKTKKLNEAEIKKAVRASMKSLFDNEKLNETGYWTASIHYNTENIHVHVATVETKNTRPLMKVEKKMKVKKGKDFEWIGTGKYEWQPRGKRTLSSISKMKSVFINSLLDRNKELEQLTQLRQETIAEFKNQMTKIPQEEMKELREIIKQLPANRKNWTYNSKSREMQKARPLIDNYMDNHFRKNAENAKAWKAFQDTLEKNSLAYKRLYGSGETERWKDYKTNKEAELRARLGNALLRELKVISSRKYDTPLEKKTEPKLIFGNEKADALSEKKTESKLIFGNEEADAPSEKRTESEIMFYERNTKEDEIPLAQGNVEKVKNNGKESEVQSKKTIEHQASMRAIGKKGKNFLENGNYDKEALSEWKSQTMLGKSVFKKRSTISHRDVWRIRRMFKDEVTSYKNQLEYERMQQQIERTLHTETEREM